MKVRDIVSTRQSGVVKLYNNNDEIAVMAHRQNRLEKYLGCDALDVFYIGGNVHIQLSDSVTI